MKYRVAGILMICVAGLQAQVISGRVVDELSKAPLPGATVQIVSSDKGTVTDEEGEYRLEDLTPGRYAVRASFVGYEAKTISDLWVKTGRETLVDLSLQRRYTGLEEVVVTEEVSFSTPGKLLITEEQINRFAATYYDPARLITSSPDVAVANDQNNLVSVRGIPPQYNTWMLEGAEIVNPNHLSNAGTFLDQPTATGGGVNILSAQMLSSSAFHYSTFDQVYGNSVGGIFDMQMKKGNRYERQYTAQASLIGIDLAAEGPVTKGGEITYAANYRYSFTGLLTHMGVDFGGESIGFQDLSFTTSLPVGAKSDLKVFGVGGLNFNHFDHRSFEDSEDQKDRSDIYYDNKMGIAGMTLSSSFSSSSLTNTLVVSGYENKRDQTNYDNQDEYETNIEYRDHYTIYSAHSSFVKSLNQMRITLGSMLNYYDYDVSQYQYFGGAIPNGTGITQRQLAGRHYLQSAHHFGELLVLTYGVTYAWNNNDQQEWDPRGKVTVLASTRSTISFGAGKYSQLYQPFNVYFGGVLDESTIINDSDFITSYRFTAAYDLSLTNLSVGAELFHFRYPKVYLPSVTTSAKTTGISVTAESAFSDGFYYRLGGSVFDAPLDEEVFKNRYNTKFNLSLAGGKEWEKAKKSRSFSINGRMMYQGGQHFQTSSFGDRYRTGDYFRFDLRVQWVRYREKYTRVLAVDLQNALNTQNESYKYFDSFLGEEVTQYQLGLIPILTYRVEW